MQFKIVSTSVVPRTRQYTTKYRQLAEAVKSLKPGQAIALPCANAKEANGIACVLRSYAKDLVRRFDGTTRTVYFSKREK